MRSTLALCTAVTFLRRRRAHSNATSRDAPALPRGDLAHGDRHVFGRHEFAAAHEHVAVGVKTLGALAENHQVDRLAGEAHAHARLGGADVGEQVELHAQPAGGVDAALFRGG